METHSGQPLPSDSHAKATTTNRNALGRNERRSSKSAVSLAWLKRFAAEHRIQQRGLTAAHLISDHITYRTVYDQCAFSELLLMSTDAVERAAVSQGRPYFFVSHARARPFAETLATLCRHFEPAQQRLWRRKVDGEALPLIPDDDVFLWLDVFSANHHTPPKGPGVAGLAELQEALRDAEETLFVMDPYGTVLQRIWCLYEAWLTCRAGPEKLLRLLVGDIKPQQLKQAFNGLDVSRAGASRESDRALILDAIKRTPASLDLMSREVKDGLVRAALVQLFVTTPATTPAASSTALVPSPALVVAPAAADSPPADYGASAAAVAAAASTAGRPDQACVQAPRVGSVDVGREVHLAALLCHLNGWLDNARPLYERALASQEHALGFDHADTLPVLHGLVELLVDQGRYMEAEALYSRALAGREARLGPEHPDTLSAVSDLALLLQAQGKLWKAEQLCRRAFEGRCRLLGWNHSDTLASAQGLAGLLRLQGRDAEALALHARALEGFERTVGCGDPRTRASMDGAAAVLESMGRYEEAEALMRRAVASSERALGPMHRDTAAFVNNLAGVLEAQGKVEEAGLLRRRTLEGVEADRVADPEGPGASNSSAATMPERDKGALDFLGGEDVGLLREADESARGGSGSVPCSPLAPGKWSGAERTCTAGWGAALQRNRSGLAAAAPAAGGKVESEDGDGDDPKKAARRAMLEATAGAADSGRACGEPACNSGGAAAAGGKVRGGVRAAAAGPGGRGCFCGLVRLYASRGKVIPVAC